MYETIAVLVDGAMLAVGAAAVIGSYVSELSERERRHEGADVRGAK